MTVAVTETRPTETGDLAHPGLSGGDRVLGRRRGLPGGAGLPGAAPDVPGAGDAGHRAGDADPGPAAPRPGRDVRGAGRGAAWTVRPPSQPHGGSGLYTSTDYDDGYGQVMVHGGDEAEWDPYDPDNEFEIPLQRPLPTRAERREARHATSGGSRRGWLRRR